MTDFELIRVDPPSGAISAWNVVVAEAVVERIDKRPQVGRNLTRDFRLSGVRHVELWEGTTGDAALTPEGRAAVAERITRPKRTRDTATNHLLEAYAASGVDLPVVQA